MSNLSTRTLAILGCGKLGEAILSGLSRSRAIPMEQVFVSARRASRAQEVAERYGCHAATNLEAAQQADLILVAVKPFTVLEVQREIQTALSPGDTVVSVAAGVSLDSMRPLAPEGTHLIRAMPNTPALRNVGMTALAPAPGVPEEEIQTAEAVFRSVGRAVVLEEKHMDAVTGLSASGPAFLYVIIESMAEAGVKVGLPRDVATELAAQTVLGAATMVLETGEHPAQLKDLVTTPAGCTVDGLLTLEEGGLRVTVIKAIVEAARRAGELERG